MEGFPEEEREREREWLMGWQCSWCASSIASSITRCPVPSRVSGHKWPLPQAGARAIAGGRTNRQSVPATAGSISLSLSPNQKSLSAIQFANTFYCRVKRRINKLEHSSLKSNFWSDKQGHPQSGRKSVAGAIPTERTARTNAQITAISLSLSRSLLVCILVNVSN